MAIAYESLTNLIIRLDGEIQDQEAKWCGDPISTDALRGSLLEQYKLLKMLDEKFPNSKIVSKYLQNVSKKINKYAQPIPDWTVVGEVQG